MKSIDFKILRFLYGLRNDNDFHDVSVLFSFIEKYEHNEDYTDFDGNVFKVINSYSKYKPTIFKKIWSRLFNRLKNKTIVDNCVMSLDEKGFVDKLVKTEMNVFALGIGDDLSYANNSICRITTTGIEYFVKRKRFKQVYIVSIISLLISITAIIISLLSKK